MGGNVIMAVLWPLAGVVADAFGLQAVFLMYAVVTLIVAGGALILWQQAERRQAGAVSLASRPVA